MLARGLPSSLRIVSVPAVASYRYTLPAIVVWEGVVFATSLTGARAVPSSAGGASAAHTARSPVIATIARPTSNDRIEPPESPGFRPLRALAPQIVERHEQECAHASDWCRLVHEEIRRMILGRRAGRNPFLVDAQKKVQAGDLFHIVREVLRAHHELHLAHLARPRGALESRPHAA